MPTSELVRYSGPKSRELQVKSDSSSFGSGGEDWITKKRVETKTINTIEKRVQRQVVLEDGRVIEEDDPEVTLDTIEDVESFSDDADDDIKHIGSLVPASTVISPWAPGYNVVGENLQRKTKTNKVEEKSVTTACANNLGDLSVKDIDGVLKRGKKVNSLVRTKDYENEDPGKIKARIVHKDAFRNKKVDIEDVREINSMNASGQTRTDRIVNREFIEDDQDETPSDGESGEETESRDGDRDAFSQRKEEKTIDYFKCQQGKSMKDAKFLRRGLHMTSYDKNDQQGGALNYTTTRPALRYDSDSTTNSVPRQQNPRKPPRPHSRGGREISRYSSSERDEPPRRFHTIERTSYGPYGAKRSPSEDRYRSRSSTRSPNYAEVKRDLKSSKELNKSTGNILRADLDTERAGRLRRAMSFKDTSRVSEPGNGSTTPKGSFLDSMKSLYATLSKAALSKVPQRPKTPNFSSGTGSESAPKRPPRKPRSQSSMSMSDTYHYRSMNSLKMPRDNESNSLKMSREPSVARSTIDGRTWDVHSSHSSTLPRSKPTPTPRNVAPRTPSNRKTRLSITSGRSTSSINEPSYMVHGFRNENRDPPKFEKQRDINSRFFGQDISDDGEVVQRSRPPPDMRRYLLDNVNRSRSSKMSQPSVIPAM